MCRGIVDNVCFAADGKRGRDGRVVGMKYSF
jgi:hypothetical protein